MQISVISKHSYSLQDVITVAGYEWSQDSEYDGKSQVTVHREPVAEEGDYLILRDKGASLQGIIDNIGHADDERHYVISVLEMPRLFDQKIIVDNESLLQTGIEDFIADQIKKNFIENPDALSNIGYLAVEAKTHTPVAAKVPTEHGIYNLCTYVGNALTNYGVFVDFTFTPESLDVTIEKKAQGDLKIDTKVSDIVGLSETYEIKVLSKLTVIWRQEIASPGADKEPESKQSIRHFYLTTDRTITEDMDHPKRAKGSADVILVEAGTEAAMIQEARNQFSSNSYQHKISFGLMAASKLVSEEEVYVGHKCLVKTAGGIKDSIISGVSRNGGSGFLAVTLGKLKVDLIEKLKRMEANR